MGVVALLAIGGWRRFSGALTGGVQREAHHVELLDGPEPGQQDSRSATQPDPGAQSGKVGPGSPVGSPGVDTPSMAVDSPGGTLARRLAPAAPLDQPAPLGNAQANTPSGPAQPSAGQAAPAAPAAAPASTAAGQAGGSAPAPLPPPATGPVAHLKEFLAGAALGGLQGWVPLGFVANAVPLPTKYTELGRGVGETLMGVSQFIVGGSAAIGGGTAAAGGVIAAPVTGGGSLLVTVGGGTVAAAGVAAVAQCVSNVGAGFQSIGRALSMPEPEPPPSQTPKPSQPEKPPSSTPQVQNAPAQPAGGEPALVTPAAVPGKPFTPISTPYGNAVQDLTKDALAARPRVTSGATLYKGGKLGVSQGPESQFWSLENPLSPGYAKRYGIPAANAKFDFVETATLKPGEDFIVRAAPGVGANPGGALEIVVNPGGVKLGGFVMPSP